MKFSQIQKSALNMMKPVPYLNVVDFAHQVVEETSKVEISQTSLVAEIHKIFLQTSLVAVADVVRAKVKIYKPKPLLLSVNQSLVRT